MFFVKKKISDDVNIEMELYEDEICTYCPNCGKEIHLEPEHLADIIQDQALSSTSVYCKKCSRLKRRNPEL